MAGMTDERGSCGMVLAPKQGWTLMDKSYKTVEL
jgi:hypothetical protein